MIGMKNSLLILVTGTLVSCIGTKSEPRASTYNISLSDLPKMEKQALGGDREVAYKLSLYFGVVELNIKESEKWYRLAYKLGEPACVNSPSVMFGSK